MLLQEPNPGIEYEFWLPRGLPQRSMVDTSALRQPQPRGAGSPPPAEPPLPTVTPRAWGHITEPLPPRSPPGVRAAAGDLPHPPTALGCVLEPRSAPLSLRVPREGLGATFQPLSLQGDAGGAVHPRDAPSASGTSARVTSVSSSGAGGQSGGATPSVMPCSVQPTPTLQCSERGSWHAAQWGRRCATRCRW